LEWHRNKGNTIIVIAHSPSILKICDNILVIEKGRIK
jgi:ABC-type multidrug transport system fused ATPase/permease subunit